MWNLINRSVSGYTYTSVCTYTYFVGITLFVWFVYQLTLLSPCVTQPRCIYKLNVYTCICTLALHNFWSHLWVTVHSFKILCFSESVDHAWILKLDRNFHIRSSKVKFLFKHMCVYSKYMYMFLGTENIKRILLWWHSKKTQIN